MVRFGMKIEKVGHVNIGNAELVLIGAHESAALALGIIMNFDPLNFKLVAIMFVFAVEWSIGVNSVDGLYVLSNERENFLFSL